jgi:hypothetical protein
MPGTPFPAVRLAVAGLLLSAAAAPAVTLPEPARAAPASRTFDFTYAVTITDVPAGKTARVWVPLASSDDYQDVKVVSKKLPPGGKVGKDRLYGNEMEYVEAKAGPDGTIPLEVVYRVTRKEVRFDDLREKPENPALLERSLQPDRLGPLEGKHLDLIRDKKIPDDNLAAGRLLYDVVNEHMKYDKPEGQPWGRGDVLWACDSRFGNCSDFHGLFIALARSRKVPAKFECGFPVPEKRGEGAIGGYHCWAWFRVEDKGWVPADISEANKNPAKKDYFFGNLDANRVAFTTGRDVELTPKQDGPPLNFFIFPYVEIDGKEHRKQERKFSYRDVN